MALVECVRFRSDRYYFYCVDTSDRIAKVEVLMRVIAEANFWSLYDQRSHHKVFSDSNHAQVSCVNSPTAKVPRAHQPNWKGLKLAQ